jgi:hypothetical protein
LNLIFGGELAVDIIVRMQMNGRKERSFGRLCTLIILLIGLGGAAWVPLFAVHLGILLCTAFTTPRSFPHLPACGIGIA